MRTHHRALVTLRALLGVPHRHRHREATLLVLGGVRHLVTSSSELGDGETISLQQRRRVEHVRELLRHVLREGAQRQHLALLPRGGHLDLHQLLSSLLHGGDVHVHHRLTLLRVALADVVGDQLRRLGLGKHLRQLEEDRLHHHVDALTQTHLLRHRRRVDHVQLRVLLRQLTLQRRRQVLLQLLHRLPGRVQHEGAALLQVLQHVVLVHVARQVAANVVRVLDVVLRLDRLGTKTHMRHRQTARLVRVEAEVRLRVQVGVAHDQLDGFLRGTHSSIRAQTV